MKKLVFSILIVCSVTTFAQIGGRATYQFLNLVSSPKIAGLGGYANANPSADLEMTYFNPALLTDTLVSEVNLNYTDYVTDINYGFAGYAFKLKDWGTFATSIKYINYGDFIAADELGTINGNFTVNETAFIITWAKQWKKNFRYGATLKFVYSDFYQYNSFGALIDLGGTYYSKKKGFMAGLVVKNLGTQIKPYTSGNYEPMPLEVQLGFSKKLGHAPFRFSAAIHNLQSPNIWYQNPIENQTTSLIATEEEPERDHTLDAIFRHFALGVELFPDKALQIRLGYNHQRRQELSLTNGSKQGMVGFSFGAGIRIKGFQFNYTRSIYSLAGSANHISISTNFAGLRKGKRVRKEKKEGAKVDKVKK